MKTTACRVFYAGGVDSRIIILTYMQICKKMALVTFVT